MTQPQIIGISKAEIFPINNTQDGFSFKNGSPLIQFEIAPNQRLLDTTLLRLNFKFKLYQSDGIRYPNNQECLSNHVAGTVQSGTETAATNSRVSVASVIQTLRLKNFNEELIEEIRDYSKMMASSLPVSNSMNDYRNRLSNKFKAFGKNPAQEVNDIMPRSVSMPLRAGILSTGQPLDLLNQNGLKLDILLSPDSFVIKGDANTSYKLENVSLSFNYINLSAPMPPSNKPIGFPTYNSYNSVINSGNSQKSLNLNLSSVRNVFQNFIPATFINNYAEDSLETPKLRNTPYAAANDVEITEFSDLKNALKFPLKYSVQERDAVNNGVFPAHLYRNFVDSIKPFSKIENSLLSEVTESLNNASSQAEQDLDNPDLGKNVYGLGLRLDTTNSGIGTNFKNQTFTKNIKSGLDGNSVNMSYVFTLSNQALAVRNQNVNPIM